MTFACKRIACFFSVLLFALLPSLPLFLYLFFRREEILQKDTRYFARMGTWSAANDTRAGKWRAGAGSERNERFRDSRVLKTIAVDH